MSLSVSSPFARPAPGLRTVKGAPMLRRPTPEEVASFQQEAGLLVKNTLSEQNALIEKGFYGLEWIQGRHFLLAGATGSGLGGALAVAVLHLLGDSGSLTVLARDLKKSLGYETGRYMENLARESGMGNRFHWLNCGVSLEGPRLEEIGSALREAGADRVVYVNTVAAASSGLLPGYPPVYIKDMDENGIFQWELAPLDERSIESTKLIMGTMAVEFPRVLERTGIRVEATAFADYRGSLDLSSRDPASRVYGRQGAYSTSLYLPKEIIQQAAASSFGTGKMVLDVFLPVMRTRALGMIPGGLAMYRLYERLLEREGVNRILVPELALGMLDRVGRAVKEEDDSPFPRLDLHEASVDLFFEEVLKRLNLDENSDYYYKRWL